MMLGRRVALLCIIGAMLAVFVFSTLINLK
jgi:hypothetical protein